MPWKEIIVSGDPSVRGPVVRGSQNIDPVPPQGTFVIPPTKARPVLVTSSVIIPSNSSSPANSLNLVNPDGESMEIYEIKIGISPSDPTLTEEEIASGEWARGLVSGAQVGIEMMLGKIAITNQAIPAWLFGLSRYTDLELVTQYPVPIAPQDLQTYQEARNDAFYTWTLKTPLYIPAGMALNVVGRNFGLTGGEVKLTIGLSGYTVEDNRKNNIVVPWVSQWSAPSFDLSGRQTAMSAETDLYNPHDQEIWIERFSGRLAMSFLPRGAIVDADGQPVPDSNDFGTGIVNANSTLTVKMKASSGDVIVRDWAPFRTVFGARNRAWQVGARLPPQQFVRVNLKQEPIDTSIYTSFAPGIVELRTQPQIAMVGWRQVQL